MATFPLPASPPIAVAGLDDVRRWGWTPLRLAQELNDFRVRSISEITAVSQRPPERWGTIHFDFPDTWRILTAGPERIIGYWQVLPLNPSVRDVLLRGQSTVHIPIEEFVRPIDRPGWYDVLVYSISVDPQFRDLFTGMLLANSMLRVFTDLARRGILFREVIASIVSRDGLLMNLGLGLDLEFVADHETAGRIYAGRLPSILNRPIAKESSDVIMRTLCELYALHRERDVESASR